MSLKCLLIDDNVAQVDNRKDELCQNIKSVISLDESIAFKIKDKLVKTEEGIYLLGVNLIFGSHDIHIQVSDDIENIIKEMSITFVMITISEPSKLSTTKCIEILKVCNEKILEISKVLRVYKQQLVSEKK